jgi:hypothetical protein
MQRRVNPHPYGNSRAGNGTLGVGSGGASSRFGIRSSTAVGPSGGSSTRYTVSSGCLLLIAMILTVVTYWFPEAQHLEQEAYAVEQKLEQEMSDWWSSASSGGERLPPRAEKSNRAAATERMLQQESKWVDGEKKLKAKLKVLAARQAEGKDLGVPVATRWLGDDIPAWVGAEEGEDGVKEWKARVQARYDEMRKEEDRWREMVSATLLEQSNAQNRG